MVINETESPVIEKNKRIVIVVGEASGDILGAGLLRELKQRYSDCSFEGIGCLLYTSPSPRDS